MIDKRKVATKVATLFYKVFDRKLNMESFTDRILLQKIVYLASIKRIKIKDFDYGFHVYGPYAPELTTIGYQIYNPANGIKTDDSTIDQTKISNLKKTFSEEIEREDSRQFELLASIFYAINELNFQTDEEIVSFIKQEKPSFEEKQIKGAIKKIKQNL